jgi:hypothetical protein
MLGSCVPQADEVIERARVVLDLPDSEIARSISADESTVHRWRSDDCVSSVVFRVRLSDLNNLIPILDRFFPRQTQIRAWLDEPLPWAAMHMPRQVLAAGRPDLLTGTLRASRDVRLPSGAL